MSDELSTLIHFSSYAYIVKKPEFLDVVKPIADEELSKYSIVDEIYPIIQTGGIANPKLLEFGNYVAQTAWGILDQQGYNSKQFNTSLNELWVQQLNKHGMHAEHIHNLGAQISGFYFLEVPENSSKPCFHDPNHAKRQINLPQYDESIITPASTIVNYTVEAGDLMLFNSWLPHSFTPNASDKPFKFMHFNIMVQPANNCAIPPAAEVV
jgi:hypothetical protein